MPISNAPEPSIQSKADDKLERSRFIERLISAVVNPATKKSTGVVVGITGPWGSGKSSILNLLKMQIRSNTPKHSWFNLIRGLFLAGTTSLRNSLAN